MGFKSKVFAVSVLVSVIFSWLYLWPNLQNIQIIRSEIQQTSEDIVILLSTQESVNDSYNFISQLDNEDFDLMELAMPTFADEINLIFLLNSLAENNGLIVDNFSIKDDGSISKIDFSTTASVSVELKLSGNYVSLKEFVKSIEKSLRIFDIDMITISTSGETESSFIFTVSGSAYYTIDSDD